LLEHINCFYCFFISFFAIKIHHEFPAPVGTASEYAHWIEFLGGNVLPAFLGPVICGSHVIQYYHWIWIAITATIKYVKVYDKDDSFSYLSLLFFL
jgi:hypothetical protein